MSRLPAVSGTWLVERALTGDDQWQVMSGHDLEASARGAVWQLRHSNLRRGYKIRVRFAA